MRRPALEVLFARAAQGQVFLLLLLGGAVLGLLTLPAGALYRRSRWMGLAAQALCVALAGGLLLGGMLLAGEGLRGYALLGLLLGMALSRAALQLLAGCVQKIFHPRQE